MDHGWSKVGTLILTVRHLCWARQPNSWCRHKTCNLHEWVCGAPCIQWFVLNNYLQIWLCPLILVSSSFISGSTFSLVNNFSDKSIYFWKALFSSVIFKENIVCWYSEYQKSFICFSKFLVGLSQCFVLDDSTRINQSKYFWTAFQLWYAYAYSSRFKGLLAASKTLISDRLSQATFSRVILSGSFCLIVDNVSNKSPSLSTRIIFSNSLNATNPSQVLIIPSSLFLKSEIRLWLNSQKWRLRFHIHLWNMILKDEFC